MPEIYDPNNGSKFRSRRRRKRNNNGTAATAGLATQASTGPLLQETTTSILKQQHCKYYKQRAPETKDPLDFSETSSGNDNYDAVSSPSSNGKDNINITRNKERVVTVAKIATTTKKTVRPTNKQTIDKLIIVGTAPSSSPVTTKIVKAKTLTSKNSGRNTFTSCEVANDTIRSTQSSCNSISNSLRHAVALDTRYLDTQEGRDDQNDFLRGVKGFLQSSFRRGLNPSIITWTESDDASSSFSSSPPMRNILRCTNKIRKITSSIRIRSEFLVEDNIDTITWNGTPIRPPINNGNTNRSIVHLPKGLMANNTWKIFGDLVKEAISHASSSRVHSTIPTAPTYNEPLRIVIFTRDTSSLLDTNQAAHQRGIDIFWEKVHNDFLNAKVQSIQIVVVTGDTIIVRSKKRDDISNDSVNCGGGKDDEQNNFVRSNNFSTMDQAHSREGSSGNEQEQEQVQENAKKFSINSNSDDNSSVDDQWGKDSVEKFSGIIKTIEYYIQKKAEKYFKANRSRIQFDTKSETCARVNISLSTIDNTVGFHSLCQKWSREMVAKVENSRRPATLCFQLPETSDFDAVELSFFAFYKSMPFRLDSPHAKNLCVDLELLSRAKMQVLQLVPIASIDASLIYGVAIGLKAALEDNEDEHQEKVLLVQSLLKNLVAKDCALLIRSKGPDVDEKLTHGVCNPEGGLFHSCKGQYFLFIPEFALSKDGPASSNGVLQRIASVDHILDMARNMDTLTLSHYQEVENIPGDNPFSEYIEASLDRLDCSPLNPWFQPEDLTSDPKRVMWKEDYLPKCSSEEKVIDRNEWTDDCGIGSLVDKVGEKSNGKKMTKKFDDVEDSDNELTIENSFTDTHHLQPQHNKLVNKPKIHEKKCVEMEWNGSGSEDSDSSSNDSTFGTFDYSH